MSVRPSGVARLGGRLGAGWAAARLAAGLVMVAVVAALLPLGLAAQTEGQTLASQNLRGYWHVFVAYLLAWALVLGWLVSVARRLARVERSLEE